jgi:tRNA A-37 threonylcarbamoyl transferase component Bud32/Tfp pilus assembly protein PilF
MGLNGLLVANRYAIVREIGRGGMATVWLADDQQHARRVAIKTLRPELAGAIGTDRFLREIRLTAQLQHPGIVPILDSGAFPLPDGTAIPWYAMPLLEGESLRARLTRETQLAVEESLRITQAVGEALEAAHRRDIVHRDIKPENVFLAGEQVYVVDFGIARALAADAERLTSTGLSMGTPAYMSPEQAVGGNVDARSDQYSLATMLYEMLAGEPPFSGPNAQATLARRLAEPPRPLSTVRSTVPSTMERAIMRALERTPADRFPTIGSFLAALRAPTEPAAGIRPRAWNRRSMIAGVLVVTLSIAAWALTTGGARVDPEVVALYERAMRAYDRRTPTGVVEAIVTLNDAIRRDSSYAPAWNALAKSYVGAWQRGFEVPGVEREQILTLAVAAVERSVDQDPDNADAWTTHGVVTQQVDPTDLVVPLQSIRRAIALDSNLAPSWHFLAIMTAENGDLSSALEAWHRSVSISPRYAQGLAFLGLGYYWRGDYDSAAIWVDSATRVDGTLILAHQTYAQVETERGRHEQAQSHAGAAVKLSEAIEAVNSTAILASAKARAGHRNMAMVDLLRAEVAAGTVVPRPSHTALWLAQVHAALGNADAALAALGRYQTRRDVHFQLHLRCDPGFAPIERDSAFRSLLVTPRPAPGSHC